MKNQAILSVTAHPDDEVLGFGASAAKSQKMASALTFDDSLARQKLGWNPSKVLDKLPEVL